MGFYIGARVNAGCGASGGGEVGSAATTTTTTTSSTTTNANATSLLKWSAVTTKMNYCSPAIDENGIIYVGSHLATADTDGANVYAFTGNGTAEWTYPLGQNYDKNFVLGAMALDDSNNSYFLVGEYNPAGGDSDPVAATYLMSLDANGSFRWRTNTLAEARGWPYCTEEPAIASDGTLFIGAGSKLLSINPSTGATKWFYDFFDGVFNVDAGDEGAVQVSSPVIDSSGKIYVNVIDYTSDTAYGVYCFTAQAATGEVVWQAGSAAVEKAENYYGSPSIDETLGRIYVARSEDGVSSKVYALNINTGARLWSFATASNLIVFATPSIGSDGTIYFGTSAKPEDGTQAGIFYALNTDGTEKWNYDTTDDVDGSRDIYTSAAIGNDGTIYFSSEYQYIYAFNADGTLYRKYDLYAILPDGLGSGTVTHTSFPIGSDGAIYCGELYGDDLDASAAAFYSFNTDSSSLGTTDWPKFRFNNKNTGRVE
ncbi:MAG: PQQ-binding-like beta-propeller repeat protein [bacterium]